MKFYMTLSFLTKPSQERKIIADYPYEAITKALYSLEFAERSTIKGVHIDRMETEK